MCWAIIKYEVGGWNHFKILRSNCLDVKCLLKLERLSVFITASNEGAPCQPSRLMPWCQPVDQLSFSSGGGSWGAPGDISFFLWECQHSFLWYRKVIYRDQKFEKYCKKYYLAFIVNSIYGLQIIKPWSHQNWRNFDRFQIHLERSLRRTVPNHDWGRMGEHLWWELLALMSQRDWLVGQMCVFQHQAIFQFSVDTDWVSCNLIQVWSYVPGDSVRRHRLRAWSIKSAPTSNALRKARLLSVLLTLTGLL